MTASGLLRERDLRALTAVVEDGLRDDPGQAMPWAVLDRLLQLIPSAIVQLDELDQQRRQEIIWQAVEDGGDRFIEVGHNATDEAPHWWELRKEFLPYRYPARTGDTTSVIRWSDFYTVSELRNTPFFDHVSSYSLDRYAIIVPLPAQPGCIRRIAFFRDNRDFSEGDRLALQLLRPHLHEVYLDAERRRQGIPHLSRREVEVLRLASQGYSNADIARILFISPATVAKHMEHIFDRTGVRTRSAAAALALPPVSAFAALSPDTRL
jgi:DNA-binding CsgD family transcriptional regulator